MMIIEVRTYVTKSGLRDDFIEFFETRAVPLQQALGMKIIGPLLDLDKPDTFVWLRGYSSLEERDQLNRELYNGDVWKGELEDIAMPMLVSYSAVLTETSPGTAFDIGR